MSSFAQSFTAVQNPNDGLSVLITDTSNWNTNTQGYLDANFIRTFILTDALGNAITSIVMPPATYTATWIVPAGTNPWVNIDFNAADAAIPVTLDLIQKYPFQRQYELAYIETVRDGCGCCSDTRIDLCQVDAFYQEAAICVPIADSGNYQDGIDNAYALLTV